MRTIFRKELADHFSSMRVFILFLLVYFASAAGLYAAHQGIRGAVTATDASVFIRLFTTSGEVLPSLSAFLILLVPIIGISFGFDAINREYGSGTMSRIISQPLYRDSIINGKFLAGLVALFIMMFATVLIVSGAGLSMIGVPPTAEEIVRIFIWLFYTVVYGAFWMSLAILFSVLFRRIATSLLVGISVWLLFAFFIQLIAQAVASAAAPVSQQSTLQALIRNQDIYQGIMRVSPVYLFSEVTMVLLLPTMRSLGLITLLSQSERMLLNPLSLGQSLLIVWPHLTSLLGLTVICFAISYVVFMRQEVRST